MKSKEFIIEAKGLDAKQFNDLIDFFIQGDNRPMGKLLASQIASMFTDAYSKDVYRAWTVSETRAIKILGDGWTGPYNKRVKLEPTPFQMKIARKFISYSWTLKGAKEVATNDHFSGNNVTLIVKKPLMSTTDILLNIAQYAKESKSKTGMVPTEKPLMTREQEVILTANEYYATIDPETIVYSSLK